MNYIEIDLSNKNSMSNYNRIAGKQGESNIRGIKFIIPSEYSEWNVYIETQNANGKKKKYPATFEQNNIAVYKFRKEDLEAKGRLFLDLVLEKGDLVFKPFSGEFAVKYAVCATDDWLDDIDVDLAGYALKADIPTKISQLKNDKGFVTSEELSQLVDESTQKALDEAIESGELTGEDGISVTHKWDDSILTITSASGTSSVDLKGEKGDSGVYVGSGDMPEGYNIQIIPDGSIEISKNVKMLYPSNFESRLMPDIYCGGFGEFVPDINIQSFKITGGSTVWISSDGDDNNDGTEISPKKTLSGAFRVDNCTTIMIKSGTYFIDEHYFSGQSVRNRNLIGVGTVIFNNLNDSGFLQTNGSAYIENIEFVGGNTCFKASLSDTDTFCAYKCKFHDNLLSSGLTVVGGNSYIIECEAYNTVCDGFNYHTNTSNLLKDDSLPCVVEWNCYVHDCGNGTGISNNASSIHDGASIIRIGGEYSQCFGGVIADQGVDESIPSYSLNFGVYAHNSTITTSGYEHFNASFWAQKYTKMWLYLCRSGGSIYDISSLDNSTVYSLNMLSENMWSDSDYTSDNSVIIRK